MSTGFAAHGGSPGTGWWLVVPASACVVFCASLLGTGGLVAGWQPPLALALLGLALILGPGWLRKAGVVVLVGALALGLAQVRLASVPGLPDAGPVEATGVVTESRPSGPGTVRSTVRMAGGWDADVVTAAASAPASGDEIRLRGTLRREVRPARPAHAGTIHYPRIEVVASGDPGPLAAIRGWMSGRLHGVLPRQQAELARGLLIGTPQFTPSFSEALRATGTSHLVAVSGFNVGIVAAFAGAVVFFLLGRRWALGVSAVVVLLFALLVGDQPSVWRAAAMWWFAAAAWTLGRPAFAISTLGLAVIALLLVDPWMAWSVSLQLSVAGTLGLVLLALALGGGRLEFLVPERLTPARGLLLAALAPVVATLFVTPLLLFHFGSASLVSPLVNLVIAPLVGPAMLASFLVILAPVPPLGILAAVPLGAMTAIIEAGARIPGATFSLAVGWEGVVVAYGLLLAGAALWVGLMPRLSLRAGRLPAWRPAAPPLAVSLPLLAVLVLAGMVMARDAARGPAAFILDVDQGDAVLLQASGGTRILVDTGPDSRLVLTALDRELPPWDRQVHLAILTHEDQDHSGGTLGLAEAGRLGAVAVSAAFGNSPGGRRILAALAARGVPVHEVRPGDRIVTGDLEAEVLAGGSPTLRSANDQSLVLRVTLAGFRLLLPGDIDAGGHRELAQSGRPLDVDVLMVPHHGSRNGLQAWLVGASSPGLAVISVGRNNRYGHPAPEVLGMLADVPVRRTDQSGTIRLLPRDGTLAVRPRS